MTLDLSDGTTATVLFGVFFFSLLGLISCVGIAQNKFLSWKKNRASKVWARLGPFATGDESALALLAALMALRIPGNSSILAALKDHSVLFSAQSRDYEVARVKLLELPFKDSRALSRAKALLGKPGSLSKEAQRWKNRPIMPL